jgi:hypothetical protein
MATHEETRKEKLAVSYDFSGIGADVAQAYRAYYRGETKGVKKNLLQIITKLEKIRKRI